MVGTTNSDVVFITVEIAYDFWSTQSTTISSTKPQMKKLKKNTKIKHASIRDAVQHFRLTISIGLNSNAI